MKKFNFKSVLRYSKREKIFRLFRFIYSIGELNGKGYSAKISLALSNRLFRFKKEFNGFELYFIGLRIHHKKSYGGYFV